MWDLRKHESHHWYDHNNGHAWQRSGHLKKWWWPSGDDQVALGVRPGGESWLSHSLAVRLLASNFVYLNLDFLIYEKTVISTLYSIVIKKEWRDINWGSNTSRHPYTWRFPKPEFVSNENTSILFIITESIHTHDSILKSRLKLMVQYLPRYWHGLFVRIL